MSWLADARSCPGVFYGTLAQDGFLIRLRIPAGLLNCLQIQAIAQLVESWDIDNVQITNRANLQVRGVQVVPSQEAFQTLQGLGLAAQVPEMDHLRNLMTSPTAGIDPQEWVDPRPLVQAIDAYLQNHPELAVLSPKFSIGIDGGGSVGIGCRSPVAWEHRYNDMQFSAMRLDASAGALTGLAPGLYWRLALAVDKRLQDTSVWIASNQCLPVVAALIQVYRAYIATHPQTEKPPRLQHLLQDWGIADYLQRVSQHLGYPLKAVTNFPELPASQPYAHLGVHPQRQVGLSYLGVSPILGRLTTVQLLGLAQLVDTFGSGELRLTPWQTLVLPNIPSDRVREVGAHLVALGLAESEDLSTRGPAIVACAGKPGCGKAATQTQAHGQILAHSLNQQLLNQQLTLDAPINIHLTGCPKSCAQASPAQVTLLGTLIEQPESQVEGYHVYWGDDHNSLQQWLGEFPFTEIPALVAQLLPLYQQHRQRSHHILQEVLQQNVGMGGNADCQDDQGRG